MSKRTYHPDRGDLVDMNFYPAVGREIDKRRPAIILNLKEYSLRTGFCIAVPVSTDLTPGPWWIALPSGLLSRPSLILCDYIKSFDFRERNAAYIAKVPDELVDEIVSQILNLLDPIA